MLMALVSSKMALIMILPLGLETSIVVYYHEVTKVESGNRKSLVFLFQMMQAKIKEIINIIPKNAF